MTKWEREKTIEYRFFEVSNENKERAERSCTEATAGDYIFGRAVLACLPRGSNPMYALASSREVDP